MTDAGKEGHQQLHKKKRKKILGDKKGANGNEGIVISRSFPDQKDFNVGIGYEQARDS